MKYHFRISRRPDGKFTVHCVESYFCAATAAAREDIPSAARKALKEFFGTTPPANCIFPPPYRGRIEDLAGSPEGRGFEFIAVPIEPRMAFALSLRRVRTRHCLFQSDVARLLGMHRAVYQRLEDPQKANPTLHTIQRLLTIFPNLDIAECFDKNTQR